ncbi:hypothetical protein [Actinoplanes auranticolor]|uniref:Uncharacterized protein n=1 Tax=Actinoplanes auranticolor TaxID=47988 RepID=A0A919SRA8_9ACTN|nr:hypothetical protein [Actinoplanes auranticolor]GIM77595.1 hypothetical protein Aau02nite_76620 [Actinoplanes auranticolor]
MAVLACAAAQLAERQRVADAGASFPQDHDVAELLAQPLLFGSGLNEPLGRHVRKVQPLALPGAHADTEAVQEFFRIRVPHETFTVLITTRT